MGNPLLPLGTYVSVRPTELRAAEWTEMNLDAEQPEWRIPPERMKMRETHILDRLKSVEITAKHANTTD